MACDVGCVHSFRMCPYRYTNVIRVAHDQVNQEIMEDGSVLAMDLIMIFVHFPCGEHYG